VDEIDGDFEVRRQACAGLIHRIPKLEQTKFPMFEWAILELVDRHGIQRSRAARLFSVVSSLVFKELRSRTDRRDDIR
jgi:hypothetical protein